MVNSVSSGDKRAARDEQRKTMVRQMAQLVRTMKEIMSDSGDGTSDESVKMLEERRQGKNRKRREKRRLRRRQEVDVLSQEDRLEHNEPNTLTTEGSQVHSEERSKGIATCKSLITETEEPRDIAHNGQMWTGSSTEIFHMCTESEPGAATDASASRQVWRHSAIRPARADRDDSSEEPMQHDDEPELEPDMHVHR